MTAHFSIKPQALHLWRVRISDFFPLEEHLLGLLSDDERSRGERFKFEIHHKRYVVARASLRQVLSCYTQQQPAALEFSYGKHGKPFLANQPLHFNISHSDDIAVFAISADLEVGVDVEKIEETFKETVAKRFFNAKEYEHLCELPDEQKRDAFYTIWSKKEALIKLLGNGIYTPLNAFSVTADQPAEKISFHQDDRTLFYHVQSFLIDPQYRAAFATAEPVANIQYWDWTMGKVKALADFTY